MFARNIFGMDCAGCGEIVILGGLTKSLADSGNDPDVALEKLAELALGRTGEGACPYVSIGPVGVNPVLCDL
jgi:hypothetical protein